jgi:hypothetical protein
LTKAASSSLRCLSHSSAGINREAALPGRPASGRIIGMIRRWKSSAFLQQF